ncbi:hypothetical protein BDW62DRAFT_86678 [Aspergillus aurantiobrunneus]
MTETSPVAITHPTTEPFPVTAPLNSPIVNGAVSDSVPPEEEEPYTIKCICAFEDDDGNTVFCEGCETWQHIECYYHGRDVPEVHNCVDCEPRHLDGRRATERQRRLREQSDGGDRKAKRSGAKSHKKKVRDHGDQVNGFHQRSESSSRDQPPPKRTKTNHRASGSVSSLSGIPVLSSDARKRTASSMSPTKSSGPSIPLYSNEFLHLYDGDHGHADMDGNLFVNLTLAADLASWLKDPVSLSQVANGRPAEEIFTWSGAALDRSHWPSLFLESMTDSNTEIDGKHPMWKVLKTQNGVGKDEIVGEITGKIGLLRDYSLDPSNRWQELRHPEPFVFFHPQLPIYIDSRQEGSILRYARRSCRPNVTMKTYITNEVEYHFCFVAKEDIAPEAEITATWYLDAQLFGSTNGLVKQEPGDSVQEMAAICISNVLANFGGCACIPPHNCLLSNLDRRRHPKITETNAKQAHARRRKAKSKSNVSPPANNSRAGSETIKNPEDDDHADSRSASSSTRGQTRSRDLTPTLHTPTEVFVFGDSELSARERRKIEAAEKKFQQLEQDQQTSHKRKKRVSGQSTQTPGTSAFERQSHSPPLSAGGHGSPRKPSGRSTPLTRHPLNHSQYVDAAVQTELDFSNGVIPSPPSSRRPNFTPLTQRLLKRCYIDRIRLEHASRQQSLSPQSNKNALEGSSNPPAVPHPTATTPSVSGEKDDVEMRDIDSPTGASSAGPQTRNESADTSPSHGRGPGKPITLSSPWPSSAAHIARIPARTATSPRMDLHVPLPPATVTSLPSATSPSSAKSSAVSSPSTLDPPPQNPPAPVPSGAGVAAPSPVKKKLSLGDYLSRRGSLKTPSSEKIQAQATAMPPPTPTQPSENRGGLATTNNTGPELSLSTQIEGPTTSDVTMKDISDSTQTAHSPSVS